VREGLSSLEPATDDEDDMLDKAWGLTSQSRLSCQIKLAQVDLTIEIPKYTINHAREDH
jgi:2Fe-2S ferredoxin